MKVVARKSLTGTGAAQAGQSNRRRCEAAHCMRVGSSTVVERRLAGPGLRVCRTCRDQLGRDLARMPALHALCERALANCAPPRSFERITGTSAHGILLNDDAVAARANIVRLLGLWSARVAIGRGVPRTGADIAWRARFLVTNLDWLAAHPQAGVLATDLRALADEAHAAARVQTRPRRVDLGRCVHNECESVMFSRSAGSGYGAAADSAQVSCDSGHSWSPHEWLSLAGRVQSFDEAADSEAAS